MATMPTRICNMSLSDLLFRQRSAQPYHPHHQFVAGLA
jgi:hypothetical protein